MEKKCKAGERVLARVRVKNETDRYRVGKGR